MDKNLTDIHLPFLPPTETNWSQGHKNQRVSACSYSQNLYIFSSIREILPLGGNIILVYNILNKSNLSITL